jgi:hypothetical protein
MYEVKVCSKEQLPVDLQDEVYDYRMTLLIIHDGERVAWHTDGGEPEDNCFGRDGRWIAPALRDAYARGLADGKKST